jgi:ribosomal peptide maturation radical SAM protein 1
VDPISYLQNERCRIAMGDVSLVIMPFASHRRPSIGVSLLKSGLRRIGVSSKIHYFSLKFAERMGAELYDKLAETSLDSPLVGELIFSRFVSHNAPYEKKTLRKIIDDIFNSKQYTFSDRESLVNNILNVQEIIPEFLDDCSYNVLREKPALLGFGSTFEQNCASIALAKRVKEISGVPIIFGGANCEGPMGESLLRFSPWIDFVCSGEGDVAFVELCNDILKLKRNRKINGIITRESNPFEICLTSPVSNMNNLPYPDFDDFFSAFKSGRLAKYVEPELVIETSRGCWWGEKSQCTFCGLNGSTMNYRSKSMSRVLEELEHLRNRYEISKFQVVDNILDMKYIDSLFPQIHLKGLDVILFYETKSNISMKQLAILKKGGVRAIQPGIESLSDSVLKIMKKGVTGLQNIQLLKWCREMDIVPLWNFLWGFPGEPESEYYRMAKIIPRLTHLHPPSGLSKITLDRFSPYFVDPKQNSIVNVRPWIAYRFLYPTLDDDSLNKIAYHFDFDYLDTRNPATYTKELERNLVTWKDAWEHREIPIPHLNMVRTESVLMINDTRPSRTQEFYTLTDVEAQIYELCDTVKNLPTLLLNLRDEYSQINREEVLSNLHSYTKKGLMVSENDRYLSLATNIHLLSN